MWAYVFEDFTGDDTAEAWALAAAIVVAQTRRRTARGPTFYELFSHLLPDTFGLPVPAPDDLDFLERRRAISDFRLHAATEWRRRYMISWDDGVLRSLRVRRAFREQSRLPHQERGQQTPGPRTGVSHHARVNSDQPSISIARTQRPMEFRDRRAVPTSEGLPHR